MKWSDTATAEIIRNICKVVFVVQKHNVQEKKFHHLAITASLLCLIVIRSCVYQVLSCAFVSTNLCHSCVKLCAIFVVV